MERQFFFPISFSLPFVVLAPEVPIRIFKKNPNAIAIRKALASIAAACTSIVAVRASGARDRSLVPRPRPATGAPRPRRRLGGRRRRPTPGAKVCISGSFASDENPPEPCWARACS